MRLDPFTITIEGVGNTDQRVYISNNPLDLMTSKSLTGPIDERNGDVISAINQFYTNDLVFYMKKTPNHKNKSTVAVVTFDPLEKKFYHHISQPVIGKNKQEVKYMSTVLLD